MDIFPMLPKNLVKNLSTHTKDILIRLFITQFQTILKMLVKNRFFPKKFPLIFRFLSLKNQPEIF